MLDASAAWPPPPPWFRAVTALRPPVPVESELSMYGTTRISHDPEHVWPPSRCEHHLYSERMPPCTELRRLNELLLGAFGRLAPALADAQPTGAGGGVAEIRTLFLNFEDLLNSLRAQQAREELIGLFETQTAAKKQLLDQLRQAGARAITAMPCAEDSALGAAPHEERLHRMPEPSAGLP